MMRSRLVEIAALLVALLGLGAFSAPALADAAANCRQETQPNVAPCEAKIAASLENPAVCDYMMAGQAPKEYLRCYLPMVLCEGISKPDAEAKASADAAAAIAKAKSQGFCK
ncbi:MAG TPA: hypothetical protein VMF53_11320 [Alphaproteobacteria bacterium]|nr:hypothetical protein [Alphaproteobacteria bacterium]